MNLESDTVENIKGGNENTSTSLHELPTEILMKIFKMLPNQQNAIPEFGLTCRRFWNIMLASRKPKEPSLLLIKNQATAEKIFKWKETLSFVSIVVYDVYEKYTKNGNRHSFFIETGCNENSRITRSSDISFVGSRYFPSELPSSVCVTLMLNLEMETTKHVEYIFQNHQKFCSKLGYMKMDHSVKPIGENVNSQNSTTLGVPFKRIRTDLAMKNQYDDWAKKTIDDYEDGRLYDIVYDCLGKNEHDVRERMTIDDYEDATWYDEENDWSDESVIDPWDENVIDQRVNDHEGWERMTIYDYEEKEWCDRLDENEIDQSVENEYDEWVKMTISDYEMTGQESGIDDQSMSME